MMFYFVSINFFRSRQLKATLQVLIVKVFRQFRGRVPPHFIDDIDYLDTSAQKSLVALAYPHAKWSNFSSWREG